MLFCWSPCALVFTSICSLSAATQVSRVAVFSELPSVRVDLKMYIVNWFFIRDVFLHRYTVTLNASPISLQPWKSLKDTLAGESLTRSPETVWSYLPCSASRQATMYLLSNTDQRTRTGSSLTAWQIEKVGVLF